MAVLLLTFLLMQTQAPASPFMIPHLRRKSGWFEVGGTSVGAPSWAAIQALGLSTGVSNFYADGSPSSYFRDITTGSNGYSAAMATTSSQALEAQLPPASHLKTSASQQHQSQPATYAIYVDPLHQQQ